MILTRFQSLSLLTIAMLVCSASAQYRPPVQNVYRPAPYPANPYYGGGYGGFGPGNVLRGQADVMNAAGNVMVQQEQARVVREQANQAKIDTQKKTFDEMMYEKANTPSYTENLEKTNAMTLKRVMNSPLESEVKSGEAQNIMLPFLIELTSEGVQGAVGKLDPYQLKKVNVCVGKGSPNIGMLRDGGYIDWPLSMRGNTQKQLAAQLPPAVSLAAQSALEQKTYNVIVKGLATLADEHKQKFRKEEIDSVAYLNGNRFLDSLDSAVRALGQPDAAKFLNGYYSCTGRTVPEVVQNMAEKGLKFAPATPGYEAPYFALHSAMASYANGAQDSQAFKAEFATNPKYAKYQK